MKSKIEISGGSCVDVPVEVMVFSGGEVNVKLPEIALYFGDLILINTCIADSDGIMALALTKNALEQEALRQGVILDDIVLDLAYTPYARQDRVCNQGEALSIKVFADMINAMNFERVFITDPHSEVTPALINNVVVTDQYETFFEENQVSPDKYHAFVAPDAGATKKVLTLLNKLSNHNIDFIQGLKYRDTKTGALSGFDFLGDVEGKNLLIVDDICDGGGTFVGLAQLLLDQGAKSVDLMVTHGIFSKGVEVLLDSGINHIYTTDSFPHGQTHESLTVI